MPLSRNVLGMTLIFDVLRYERRQNWQNQPSVDFKCCFIFTLPLGKWSNLTTICSSWKNSTTRGKSFYSCDGRPMARCRWCASSVSSSINLMYLVPQVMGVLGGWVGGFLGQGKIRNGQFVGGFQPKFVGIMLWLVRFCSRKEWENYGDTPCCFFLGISWDACFLGFSRLIPSFFANHLFLSRCGSIWM